MKYTAPYGSADPNAGYVDRNTPAGQPGSKVPALAIEGPMREVIAVIQAAGLVPSNKDFTQLLQAIGLMIDAATGGAGDENYVLMMQARSRLPIFPEVSTSDGQIPVVSPGSGIVRVPAGYSFLHRGIFNVTTVQTDFVTAANKTYHLRWNKTDGFALKDLADVAYNAGAVAETSAIFDSTFDDMLVAKVITNLSNVPSVTNLANKSNLVISELILPTSSGTDGVSSNWFGLTKNLNWARRPTTHSLVVAKGQADNNAVDNDFNIRPLGASLSDLTVLPALFDIDRYRLSQTILRDNTTTLEMHFSARA